MISDIAQAMAWCLFFGLSPFWIIMGVYVLYAVSDMRYWQQDNERMLNLDKWDDEHDEADWWKDNE